MAVNFLILMVIYMLSRWFFFYMNLESFPDVTFRQLLTMSLGGLRFDLNALLFLNLPCIVLQFLPLKCRHTVGYQRIVKVLFLILNSLGIVINMADVVYFPFGGRRATSVVFSESSSSLSLALFICVSVWDMALSSCESDSFAGVVEANCETLPPCRELPLDAPRPPIFLPSFGCRFRM